MMKIMFAIADPDGDGALSFDEVTAIHRRIFNASDTNKHGKVTRRSCKPSCRTSAPADRLSDELLGRAARLG
jgi:hypothetical protein